jgi:hypothetical protein
MTGSKKQTTKAVTHRGRKDKDDALLLIFVAEYIVGQFKSGSKSFIRIQGG